MNTNVTIARLTCPKCGKPDVPMRNNFTLHEHRNADTEKAPGTRHCIGLSPELMLTCLLRIAGLDARPDRNETELLEDPEWLRKQAIRDERDRRRYGWAEAR